MSAPTHLKSRNTVLDVQNQVVMRIMRHFESIEPQDGVAISTLFMRKYVFARAVFADRIRHARWCLNNGDLSPFRASEDEMDDIVHHLYHFACLTPLDIGDLFEISEEAVNQRLSRIAMKEQQ